MTETRVNISSGSKFEAAYGYSRAVKVGDTLYISGTIGMDFAAGTMPEDAIGQLRQVVKNLEMPLAKVGSSIRDIVQITTYVSAPEIFAEIGPEMGRIFADTLPVNAALVVGFPVPGVLVEISATARIGCAA